MPPQTTAEFLLERQQIFHNTVIGQIEGSEEYPVDEVWQEDYMLERLNDLFDQQVITDVEHLHIYTGWIVKRRPDTTVVKVTPKPRGHGRGYMYE